jgi:hypothetical protein
MYLAGWQDDFCSSSASGKLLLIRGGNYQLNDQDTGDLPEKP